MLTESSFGESLHKAENDARFMLDSYLKEPTAENLHGLRTSARRVLTIIKILPGKAREGKTKKRLDSLSKLLDLTQKARHLDIVLSRISSSGQVKSTEPLVKSLEKTRDSSLRAAQSIAASLKGKLTEESRKVGDSTVQKRFARSEEKLTGKIEKILPAVKKGSIKRKELQQLRQDARKLRYLLELSASPAKSERLGVLRTWQEVLAAIHDNDACIELLKDSKNSRSGVLVRELTAERTQNFEKFKSIVEEKGLPNATKEEAIPLAA